MVKQYDYTQCTKHQCEYAMHNYLFYFAILHHMPAIRSIITHIPGRGHVHSVARNTPLSNNKVMYEHGLVYNFVWPIRLGLTPVLHQFDRDNRLKELAEKRTKEIIATIDYNVPWNFNKFVRWNDLATPTMELLNTEETATLYLEPTLGSHRPSKDAVFSCAEGYDLHVYALFVTSLRETGFDGDIVLSVSNRDEIKPEVFDFLEYHSNHGLVVYEGKIETVKWLAKLVNVYAPSADSDYYFMDPRKPRANSIVQLELYWALSTLYKPDRKILVIEAKNTYFQRNPFSNIGDYNSGKDRGELHIFGVSECVFLY